ncbi:MAG: SPOR domain-containing protein [Flavobacteriales bacterium]|nr:SPOR domain-containing protein [Flavobacteriales bacterium]
MKYFLLVCIAFVSQLNLAQNSQEKAKDTLSINSIEIILDSDIDSLLTKTEERCDVIKVANAKKTSQQLKKEQEAQKIDNIRKNVDLCYMRDKVDGVKIKVGITKDIQQAKEMREQVMKLFPHLTTPEIKDVRPHYYVMIGDYFTREAAKNDLRKVREKFPNAVLTNWRVYCRKAALNGK